MQDFPRYIDMKLIVFDFIFLTFFVTSRNNVSIMLELNIFNKIEIINSSKGYDNSINRVANFRRY